MYFTKNNKFNYNQKALKFEWFFKQTKKITTPICGENSKINNYIQKENIYWNDLYQHMNNNIYWSEFESIWIQWIPGLRPFDIRRFENVLAVSFVSPPNSGKFYVLRAPAIKRGICAALLSMYSWQRCCEYILYTFILCIVILHYGGLSCTLMLCLKFFVNSCLK